MPELPDLTVYLERLEATFLGQPLEKIRVVSPFLVRSYEPKLDELEGHRLIGLRRIGKRLVFELDGDLFLVIHLMIAGRLHLRERGAKIPGRLGLAAFDFPSGTVLFTEAGTSKRASLHAVRGEPALAAFDRGGIEPLSATGSVFKEALLRENHTLKRTLTDPRLFSGIGNAYSDEILFRAKLSPVKLTRRLEDEEIARLREATRATLGEWIDRLLAQVGDGFPEKVTAFHPEMAVHGKYGQPCPVCGTKVQRIRYANNEVNYCSRCQTQGKVLADRGLSRLLRGDWPKSIDELEEREGKRSGATAERPERPSRNPKA